MSNVWQLQFYDEVFLMVKDYHASTGLDVIEFSANA